MGFLSQKKEKEGGGGRERPNGPLVGPCMCVCVCVCMNGVRYENSNKVIFHVSYLWPRRAIIMSRRPHPRTGGPPQWHVTRGGHIEEKKLWGGG